MTDTINNGIPFVPENTIDPAAGLNLSLLTLDAQVQLAVESVGLNTPPASPAQGARYIVGTAPTGAWAGQANALAMYLDTAWRFYAARYALNKTDGRIYLRTGTTWAAAGGATWGGITGALSAQTDLQGALDAKQPLDATLTALAGVTTSADQLIYATGADTFATATLTAQARALLDDVDQAAQRVTLELVKQTGPTDTTAGAMMAVGAFGLGGTGPTVTDFNASLPTGIYGVAVSGVLNAPSSSFSASTLYQREFDGNVTTQLVIERLTGNIWSRVKSSGIWATWRRQYDTGNILGTVSQSAGVPTGAIIERGSNANGEYVRYADGTQICMRSATASTEMTVSAFGGYRSSSVGFAFAATFASPPNAVSASPDTLSGISCGYVASTVTASSVAITWTAVTSTSAAERTASITAIGRWF